MNPKRIREANNVFTPFLPVDEAALFCGRESELDQIETALLARGKHVLLYGDRGVGKSSLARQACRKSEMTFYTHQCSSQDTFKSIIEDFFKCLQLDYLASQETTTNGGVELWVVKGDVKTTSAKRINYEPSNPSWVGKELQNHECALIIDEFDVISSIEEKAKISQLIKILSDIDSKAKILVVGIGTTSSELIAGHESISRCLEEVHLDRMKEDELNSILEKGSQRLEMKFEEDVKKTIVVSSNGFPYFTQLLGLESTLSAIKKDMDTITMDDYEEGLSKALKSIDKSLLDAYTKAVGDRNNLGKRQLLYSVATANKTEITTQDIKDLHKREYGVDLETVNINGSLYKAIGNDNSALLQRIRQGVYIFSNPLMAVFILLLGKPANE